MVNYCSWGFQLEIVLYDGEFGIKVFGILDINKGGISEDKINIYLILFINQM